MFAWKWPKQLLPCPPLQTGVTAGPCFSPPSTLRRIERAEEGHAGHAAHRPADLPVTLHLQRVCLLRPTHRHLLLQPQAGLLQRQPQGGQLHVPVELRGIPRQVGRSFVLFCKTCQLKKKTI